MNHIIISKELVSLEEVKYLKEDFGFEVESKEAEYLITEKEPGLISSEMINALQKRKDGK